MYCGRPTRRGRKGEHIIPEVIGGARTLNDGSGRIVCPDCNSGVLSLLDRELCCRSFLSAVASQQLDGQIWQAWDVDHAAKNLLVEAKPIWDASGALDGLSCYPQITFERDGPDVRGTPEEFRQIGREDFPRVLFGAVRHCFGRYRDGSRALHFEKVRSGAVGNGYRLPPRIYTRHPITAIAANIREQAFVLRFVTEEDKQFVLQTLPNLGDGRRFKKWEIKPGSHHPTISFFFDIGETIRALMKIGLNLIAAYCPNTPVDRQSFSQAVRLILGESGSISSAVLRSNGFVAPDVVADLRADGNAHAFRLIHVDRTWHVYSSFFGGKIGSYVRFSGPNGEAWRQANIVAPIGSKEWNFSASPLLPVMKVARVEWADGRVVTPSFDLHSRVSSVSVERVMGKRVRR